jgi:hypothetical protein
MVLAEITEAGIETLASNLGDRVAVTITSSNCLKAEESTLTCAAKEDEIKRQNINTRYFIV